MTNEIKITPVKITDAFPKGNIVDTSLGEEFPVHFRWINLDHEYRVSGDWVEEGDKIAHVTAHTKQTVTEQRSRLIFPDKEETIQKENEESHTVRAPDSGFICRSTPSGRKQKTPSYIGFISPDISFKNEQGSTMSAWLTKKERSRNERLLFSRSLSNLRSISKSDCRIETLNTNDDKLHKIKISEVIGFKSKKSIRKYDYIYHYWNDKNKNRIDGTSFSEIDKDDEYIYYFLEEEDEVKGGELQAVFFQADEFWPDSSTKQDENTEGYVYVLVSSGKPGIVKIGATERDPESRAEELSSSTGVSMPYIVAYEVETDHPYELESQVHDALKDSRITPNREFFEVPTKEAISTIQTLHE